MGLYHITPPLTLNYSATIMVDLNLVVCLTGAAGQIAYSLLPSLCDGSIFGTHKVKHGHINTFLIFFRKSI